MQFIPLLRPFANDGPQARTISPDSGLTWGDQLLDALDYLHTQDPQIIHRTSSLRISSLQQRTDHPVDFGWEGTGRRVSVVTTSASIYGYTPNYAPLEQIQEWERMPVATFMLERDALSSDDRSKTA